MSTIPPLPADNLDFAWDRPETVATLRARLQSATGTEWLRTAAWLMREARVEEVADRFSELSPLLGRRQPVWEHLLRAARELGRI